jgi:UDP:flavonoid glycosyltransferase YjiC (YdhE family)
MALGEMGHLMPIIRIVAALERSGHEVMAILTNGYAEEHAHRAMKQYGVNCDLLCPGLGKFTRNGLMKGLDKQNDESAPVDMSGFSDPKVVQVFREEVDRLEPDMLLADYFSAFPLIVADECQLPVVVNIPNNLSALRQDFLPVPDNTVACCGCLCMCPAYG